MYKKIKKINKSDQNLKFVEILKRLMDYIQKNIQYQSIIAWSNDGDKIMLYDKFRFKTEIIPMFFKHQNYDNFKKQVKFSMQNKDGQGNFYFHHQKFTRDLVEFAEIKRREQLHSQVTQIQYDPLYMEHEQSKIQLSELKHQQRILQEQLILSVDQTILLQKNIQQLQDQMLQFYLQDRQFLRRYLFSFLWLFKGYLPYKQKIFLNQIFDFCELEIKSNSEEQEQEQEITTPINMFMQKLQWKPKQELPQENNMEDHCSEQDLCNESDICQMYAQFLNLNKKE